jgi:hypothetical protein
VTFFPQNMVIFCNFSSGSALVQLGLGVFVLLLECENLQEEKH